ncbi:YHYH domain-containing protein [Terrisporobacter hibernicus]|uniref:YHYH domain-containing protein n=1 Tax=Terrisporobacter hibernicus TaxID=2813371 RepID=UPI0023F2C401|nr:YHYH domain-containing protein [Terrisporobacter hibernicus]
MKKKIRGIILIVLLICSQSLMIDAHSGRTDSSGGHRDNKNKSGLGSYHYHCGGYPPHLHTNGCPYKGGGSTTRKANSGSSSSSRKNQVYATSVTKKDIRQKGSKIGYEHGYALKDYNANSYSGTYSVEYKEAYEEFFEKGKEKILKEKKEAEEQGYKDGLKNNYNNEFSKDVLSEAYKESYEDGKEKYIVSLGHDKNSLALRNYDLAYEFSFIISNELNIPAKRFNKDDFASALLLPRNKLIEELDNPNELESYLEVKSKFMVPLTIILYRSYALGLINYKKYNYLMNEISKNGWHKEEPLDNVKATHPNCLRKAYKLLLDNNIVSKNTLIEKLYNENMILYGDDLEILMGLKEGSLADKKDVKVLSFNNKNNK